MSHDTCSIDGCEKRILSRGWCSMHYQRWSKHGDPTSTKMPTRVNGTTEDRFWAKVLPADAEGCQLWRGATYPSGYGTFLYKGKSVGAHRASYEMNVGPIPPGLEIDHTCHTRNQKCAGGVTCKHRKCVTPSHLEPVTGAENNRRGRSPSAIHGRKTHCVNNHPFDEENTYVQDGKRTCKTCRRASDKKRGWRR